MTTNNNKNIGSNNDDSSSICQSAPYPESPILRLQRLWIWVCINEWKLKVSTTRNWFKGRVGGWFILQRGISYRWAVGYLRCFHTTLHSCRNETGIDNGYLILHNFLSKETTLHCWSLMNSFTLQKFIKILSLTMNNWRPTPQHLHRILSK